MLPLGRPCQSDETAAGSTCYWHLPLLLWFLRSNLHSGKNKGQSAEIILFLWKLLKYSTKLQQELFSLGYSTGVHCSNSVKNKQMQQLSNDRPYQHTQKSLFFRSFVLEFVSWISCWKYTGMVSDAAVSMGGVSSPFNQKLYISHPLLASLLSSKFSPGNQHFPHIKDAWPKSGFPWSGSGNRKSSTCLGASIK